MNLTHLVFYARLSQGSLNDWRNTSLQERYATTFPVSIMDEYRYLVGEVSVYKD